MERVKNFTGKIAYYFYLNPEEDLGISRVKLTARIWNRARGGYNNEQYEGEVIDHIYGPKLEDSAPETINHVAALDVIDMLFTDREVMSRIWEWIGK